MQNWLRIAIAGRALFDSAAGVDLPPERRRIGYVFQEGRLFPHLSVRTNLLYGHRRIPPADRAISRAPFFRNWGGCILFEFERTIPQG